MSWNVQADGYFITLPEWVEELEISPQAFRLWCRLAKLANRERGHSGKRTREELATLMGCSKDTVDRLVKELEEAQALRVDRDYNEHTKRYRPSTYTVLTARPAAEVEGGRTDAARGTDAATPGRTDAATGGRTDADASSSLEKDTPPENEGAAPASPSPRPSRSTRASNGPRDAGLTPGSNPKNSAACPSSDVDPARALADEMARGAAVTPVRQMTVAFRAFLAKGEPIETLRQVAAGRRIVTEGTIGLALDQRDRPRPGAAPRKPAPPVVRAQEREAVSEEERAEIARMQAELKARLAERKRRPEQPAAAPRTLVAPEEVPA